MGRKQKNKVILDHLKKCLLLGDFSRSDNEFVVKCPFCHDKKGHCYINYHKKVSFCFVCRTATNFKIALQGHSVKSLLYTYTKKQGSKDFVAGTGFRADCAFVVLISTIEERQQENISSAVKIDRAYDYCIDRGITLRQMRDYSISVKPYESRVYFPVWDKDIKTIFYMGRTLINQIPKTVEMKNSSKPLYGRHVNKVEGDTVILVEGVFDHFATPNSYALMGIHITKSQIAELKEDNVKRVFVIGDPDSSRLSIGVSKLLLSKGVQAFPVQLLNTSKDPAELGRETMGKIVNLLFALPKTKRSTVIRLSVNPDE